MCMSAVIVGEGPLRRRKDKVGPEAKQDHHQNDASQGQPEALASKEVRDSESGHGGQGKERPPYLRLRRWKNASSGLQIFFNFLVVVFTGALVWVSYRQLEVTRESVEVAREATEATKRAAEAAVIAAQTAQGQLREMQSSSADTKAVADAAKAQAANTEKLALAATEQSKAARDFADAAKSSARTADQTLSLTHRPWVWAKHEVDGSLLFSEQIGAVLSFNETLENVGQSVAVDIVSWADLIPSIPANNADYNDALAVRRQHCDALRRPQPPGGGEVLFPKQAYPPAWRVAAARNELTKKVLSLSSQTYSPGQIAFTLVGCVSYRASFEAVDARRHQTRFLYTLAHPRGGGGWVLLKPAGSISGLVLALVPEANTAD
jgi:hypothetical protein